MRIITIVGARPQFIKASAVSRVLLTTSCVEEVLVHTGQHYDDNMSEIFFRELEIPRANYNLGIGSSSHAVQTGMMLAAIEDVLLKEKSDLVLVYGDTNSTLAGALAASKLHIPVAHVEAGLRSYNRQMPEEINRVLTDHMSILLFAPTTTAVRNLHNEGIPHERIKPVGDVMYDAALFYGDKAEKNSIILKHFRLSPKSYLLATIHRAENTDSPRRLRTIFEGLTEIAKEIPIVFPLHPRTREALNSLGMLKEFAPKLKLVDPVGYLDMVMLEKNAYSIVTDSGGVQKEAFFYRVPCVTLREETEWTELLEMRWNRLANMDNAQQVALSIKESFESKGQESNPYGKGKSAQSIVKIIKDYSQSVT